MSLIQALENLEMNSQWIAYICGAKDVIRAVQSETHVAGSDSSVILGWVYYYDVLARFCLRHWRTPMVKHTAKVLGFNPRRSQECAVQYLLARSSFSSEIPNIASHCHQVLGLLSEVCNTVLYPWGSQYHSDDYREHLRRLEWRLRSVSFTLTDALTSPHSTDDSLTGVIELFRLAGLVYLERATRNFSGQCTILNQWTEEAFSILSKLDVCRYPFPIFIFGCEAHTDDRRMTVLDLLSRTEQDPHVWNMQDARALVQCAWVQEDLEVDREVEYIRKLNIVLSSRDVIPRLF